MRGTGGAPGARYGDAMTSPADDLYAAFARFPRPTSLDACPCCVTDEERTAPLRAPLRMLPEDAIGEFAFSAMNTFGCEADYLYFLPRILELTWPGSSTWPGLEGWLVRRKLDVLPWEPGLRDAVEAYLRAAFSAALGSPSTPFASALEQLAWLSPDIDVYLSAWSEDRRPEAAVALATTLARVARDGVPYMPCDPTDPPDVQRNLASVQTWLHDPARVGEVEAAVARFPGPDGDPIREAFAAIFEG